MTIGELLKKYKEDEAELLLAHVIKAPKEFLLLHPEQPVSNAQTERFQRLMAKFRNGVPAAYLLGYKYFYGLKFKVSRSVLIPRPESEWLVDRGLEFLRTKRGHQRVLDMGTGSGNLIISLATSSRTSVEWVGADISKGALRVAGQNASMSKTKIQFLQSDLFTEISGKFDLIIANLPYVPAEDYRRLHKNLKFEPVRALTDNGDGAGVVRKFLKELPARLRPNGLALIETDPTHKNILTKWVKEQKLPLALKFHKDYRGLWRFAEIKNSR